MLRRGAIGAAVVGLMVLAVVTVMVFSVVTTVVLAVGAVVMLPVAAVAMSAVVAATMFVVAVATVIVVAELAVTTGLKGREPGDLADDAVGAGHRRPDVRLDDFDFDDAIPRNCRPSTGQSAFRTR